ncbi:MAG: hypothetical protein HLUCCA12_09150 [Rhodobacteraceae bacterium HLUCCA12]|nr:MAG: hypothetical protein HLUCCA12_09150 [Rhodobacteraceae bacterium HLUCCA12]
MYEYKVIPAPQRAAKVKGLKTTGERFAHLLEVALNDVSATGWDFLRAETLPCEERKGLTGTAKSFQTVLVFRRWHDEPDLSVEEDPATTDEDYAPPHENDETDAMEDPAPRLSLVAARAGSGSRQEPVLRPGAALRATATDRAEPVLRHRQAGDDAPDSDNDRG